MTSIRAFEATDRGCQVSWYCHSPPSQWNRVEQDACPRGRRTRTICPGRHSIPSFRGILISFTFFHGLRNGLLYSSMPDNLFPSTVRYDYLLFHTPFTVRLLDHNNVCDFLSDSNIAWSVHYTAASFTYEKRRHRSVRPLFTVAYCNFFIVSYMHFTEQLNIIGMAFVTWIGHISTSQAPHWTHLLWFSEIVYSVAPLGSTQYNSIKSLLS